MSTVVIGICENCGVTVHEGDQHKCKNVRTFKADLKLLWKKLTVKRRAYLRGVNLTHGNAVIPMTMFLPLNDKRYCRHLLRLNRISRGLKPFQLPKKRKFSWDGEWYAQWCGAAK